MVLFIILLEDKHKIVLHLSILYEYQQFFQHRICFSIQPPDYSDPWPRLARSSSFSLILLFEYIYHFKWTVDINNDKTMMLCIIFCNISLFLNTFMIHISCLFVWVSNAHLVRFIKSTWLLNYFKIHYTCNLQVSCLICIRECPSNSPFLKNNGAEPHCF